MCCRQRWERGTGQVALCRNSHKSEQKLERVGRVGDPQRRPGYAQERGRSDAEALSEKPGGLVKKSRRKE